MKAPGADAASKARFLGLHPTVLLMAGTHFIVDGYSNIYAPLLPLLIPHLQMSLFMAGTLQMCFQIANSVAQLAFGHIADHWRPRVLVIAGPLVAVSLLALIGLPSTPFMLGVVLVLGGLGAAAFHPPAAALVHRISTERKGFAMSFHITGGSLGFSLGPLIFAPFAERYGLQWTPLLILPALAVLAVMLPRVPQIETLAERGAVKGFKALRPYRKPLTLLYLIVVLRTLTALSFATFMPVMLTRRGMTVAEAGTAMAIYLFSTQRRRVFRRRDCRSLGTAERHHVVAGAVGAVSGLRADADRLDVRGHRLARRFPAPVDTAGKCFLWPNDRPHQRRNRVVADDGLRLGNRRAQRAVCRHAGRPHWD